MDIYTHVNKDAKRGAAGAVPEMFWAHGRRPLDSAARLWYTGIGDPKRMASKGRGPSPRPFSYLQGVSLRGPSRPVGESGSDNLRDKYYLLALVLYEHDRRRASLPLVRMRTVKERTHGITTVTLLGRGGTDE